MSLTSPRYWLKADTGRTSPVNAVTGTGALSGGTVTLTEITTGVWAYRCTGAASIASFTALTTDNDDLYNPADGSRTFAIRAAIGTMPTSGAYARLFGFSFDTDLDTNGAKIARNGSDTSFLAWMPANTDSVVIDTALAIGTALKTVVVRLNPVSGLDNVSVWVETVGRAGTAANFTSAGASYSEALMEFVNFIVQPGGGSLDIADAVLWPSGDLTDAECAAVADGLRTALSDPAPTIGTQPTSQSVTAPAAATFTASVSGTYTGLRWQRQAAGAGAWADVSGATSTTLTTGATSVTGGSWNSTDRVRLAVDWSGGVVYSTDVALTVAAGGTAPAITVQPANTSVTVGSTAAFSVTATGSGTKTYQWERQPAAGGGYSAISGATSASYTTPVTTISGGSANLGDTYRCVVTGDTAPPATSSAATLTVLYPVATTVSVTLTTDGSTPAASLTNLKWAFYDQATPDLFTAAPVAKGAVETTDGSGVFSASITGTALRQNDVGYLIVTNSDGTTSQGAALKCFSAPVTVS